MRQAWGCLPGHRWHGNRFSPIFLLPAPVLPRLTGGFWQLPGAREYDGGTHQRAGG